MLHFLTDVQGAVGLLSTRTEGNMKLRDEDNDEDAATRDRQRNLLAEADIDYDRFSYAYVVHGVDVLEVTEENMGEARSTDALVTKQRNVFLGLTVADCFPVYFMDPVAGVCGVAHAGWRGTIKNIIPRTIAKMKEMGAQENDIQIEVGPGISEEHFDFQFAELIKEFGEYAQDKYIKKEQSDLGKVQVNLQAIILDQVRQAGVPQGNIRGNANCTFAEDQQFFSARRHQGNSHSAMLAVIGMRST